MAMRDLGKTATRLVAGLLLFVAAGCSGEESNRARGSSAAAPLKGSEMITGTVRHIDLEGGFYGIVADDGTKLDPVNLPKDFQQDGVRLQVRVEELTDRVSTHMWGKLVRIIEIERLRPSGG